jgi:spore coat polysaccharide biosynthesis protein SpsF
MSMAILIEASLGSKPLPGKVLKVLAGRTLLEHTVTRLRASGLPIIVAASADAVDEPLEKAANELGVSLYRGASGDVLGRVLGAADAFGLTELIRARADHPAVDIGGVQRIAELRRRVHADHAMECGLPQGTAVEAVTVDALRRSHSLVTDPYDLENVTSFIRRDTRFTAMRAVAPGHLRRPGLRLTVQSMEELEFMHSVLSATPTLAPDAPLEEIIAVAEAAVVRLERARLAATRKGA